MKRRTPTAICEMIILIIVALGVNLDAKAAEIAKADGVIVSVMDLMSDPNHPLFINKMTLENPEILPQVMLTCKSWNEITRDLWESTNYVYLAFDNKCKANKEYIDFKIYKNIMCDQFQVIVFHRESKYFIEGADNFKPRKNRFKEYILSVLREELSKGKKCRENNPALDAKGCRPDEYLVFNYLKIFKTCHSMSVLCLAPSVVTCWGGIKNNIGNLLKLESFSSENFLKQSFPSICQYILNCKKRIEFSQFCNVMFSFLKLVQIRLNISDQNFFGYDPSTAERFKKYTYHIPVNLLHSALEKDIDVFLNSAKEIYEKIDGKHAEILKNLDRDIILFECYYKIGQF